MNSKVLPNKPRFWPQHFICRSLPQLQLFLDYSVDTLVKCLEILLESFREWWDSNPVLLGWKPDRYHCAEVLLYLQKFEPNGNNFFRARFGENLVEDGESYQRTFQWEAILQPSLRFESHGTKKCCCCQFLVPPFFCICSSSRKKMMT